MGISLCSKRIILFGNFMLLFLLVNSTVVNSQKKDDLKPKNPVIYNTNNGTKVSKEQVGGARFDSSSLKSTHEKKEEKSENSNEVIEKDGGKRNVSESLLQSIEGDDQEIKDVGKNTKVKNNDGNEGDNTSTTTEHNSIEVGSRDEGEKKDSSEIETRKDDGNEDSNGSLIGMEKSKVRDDECDPSNMCVDEKKNFTACLRVPGNDSPDLSLLIQNKGSKPVTITITAPQYVQLEETKVHLQQKEDKKVRVSVAYEAMDSSILLTTEDSRCTLDFKDLVPHDSRIGAHYTFKLGFFNLTKTHFIIFLTLSAFVVFGSIWMCSGFYKKLYNGNGYQTLKTELPISGVSSISRDSNDGWDDTWDDNWDDEEAPKTPALPATPNLSSRGLASRRLNKDGWKD